jgi:hypothetical protein
MCESRKVLVHSISFFSLRLINVGVADTNNGHKVAFMSLYTSTKKWKYYFEGEVAGTFLNAGLNFYIKPIQ